MPTRLTCVTPPPAPGADRTSAQTTPYCSPGAASAGTATVILATLVPPAGRTAAPGTTDVQLESSLAVWPSAPRNVPLSMVAAEEYSATLAVESVELGTCIRRLMTAPGRRRRTVYCTPR